MLPPKQHFKTSFVPRHWRLVAAWSAFCSDSETRD